MGWFLTGSTKKKGKRKRSTRRGAAPKPWDPQRTLLALTILALFALVVAGGIGWRYGEAALERYVAQRHASEVRAQDVTLTDAPAWMTTAVREELAQLVAQRVGSDPLDGRSLREAAATLAASPWVRRVEQVHRIQGGRVLVSATYRQPVAVVEARDGYHLVDAEGVRLPGLYFQYQVDQLALPLMVGVASAPRAPGQVWPGKDVQAGLALVGLLAAEPYFDQVRAVDVGQRDARGRIRLVMHTAGGQVRWGLPPGEERAIEPDALVKRQWLRRVAQTHNGRIDAGGKIVDVYGATVQVSQPTLGTDAGGLGAYTIGR